MTFIPTQNMVQGRLTLTSGLPITTSDVLSASSIYFTPCYGNNISLPDASGVSWTTVSFSEQTIAVPSAILRMYDVFAYLASGALACETNAWDSSQTSASITGATAANPCVLTATGNPGTGALIGIAGISGTIGTNSTTGLNGKVFKVASSDSSTITLETGIDTSGLGYTSGGTYYIIPTSRNQAISIVSGQYVKTADKSRLYLGTFLAGANGVSGETEDSIKRRLLFNNFNRVHKLLFCIDLTPTYDYTSVTIRPRNNNITAGVGRVELVLGLVEELIQPTQIFNAVNTGAGGVQATNGIGVNTVSASTVGVTAYTQVANVILFQIANRFIAPTSLVTGYMFMQSTESSTASGTTSWIGNGNTRYDVRI